jgi:coatomer protein complex subunit gamma
MLKLHSDRCLDDVDDEVRDRAALYLKVFREKSLADTYVKEGKTLSSFSLETEYLLFPQNLFSP